MSDKTIIFKNKVGIKHITNHRLSQKSSAAQKYCTSPVLAVNGNIFYVLVTNLGTNIVLYNIIQHDCIELYLPVLQVIHVFYYS